MYGYENISRLLPPRSISVGGLNDYQKGRRRVREILTGVGAHEGWTGTFLSRSDLEGAGFDPTVALELENPLDQSQNLLRTSVLPGLLNAARFNAERQAGALSLFEVGSVFRRPAPGSPRGLIEGVMEWEQLGLVALGQEVDAGYAVEAWEVLARGLRLGEVSVEPLRASPDEEVAGALAATSSLHAGRRASVGAGEGAVGLVGELAPEIAASYDLAGRVAVLIVDLAPLLGAPERSWEARRVSRFPAVDLDIAFVTEETVPAGEVAATISEAAGELAESVGLFDVWRDPSLGEGRRSLAFRARLRAAQRTLTEPEVAEVREKVVSAVQQRHGAVVRGA
jgi:phenylalanyl-tRNA synthetase beta chain